MRCFFTCFTDSKSKKHNKRIHILNRDVAVLTPPLESTTTLQIPIPQPKENKLEEEEQFNFDLKDLLSPEKAATDKVGEEIEVKMGENEQEFDHDNNDGDDDSNLVEEESCGSLFSLSIDSRRRKSSGGEKVTSSNEEALSPQENPPASSDDKGGENEVKMGENEQLEDDDDDDDGRILVEAESSDSLFSLSIDSRKLISCGGDLGEKEVSSPISKCCSRESNQNQTVLTPVESQKFPQLKAVKAKVHHQEDKENMNSQQHSNTCSSYELLLCKKERANRLEKKLSRKEIAVETSLSSWLIEPEKSSNSAGNSVNGGGEERSSPTRSRQNRHVLGALTVRQCTISTTPTRRNSLSSDDTSNLGTVGSYWRHTTDHSSASSRRILENSNVLV